MSHHPVFCLDCGSNCCLHLQKSHARLLTPREVSLLRALLNPEVGDGLKQIAHSLGLQVGTLKIYLSHMYDKLGWQGGSHRRLLLWAVAHREQLQLELPIPGQFKTDIG